MRSVMNGRVSPVPSILSGRFGKKAGGLLALRRTLGSTAVNWFVAGPTLRGGDGAAAAGGGGATAACGITGVGAAYDGAGAEATGVGVGGGVIGRAASDGRSTR